LTKNFIVGTLSSLLHTHTHTHTHTNTPVVDNVTVIYVLVMKQICMVLKFQEKFFHVVSPLILTNIKSDKTYSPARWSKRL